MTIVISGTNRPGSSTLKLSNYIYNRIEDEDKHLLDLQDFMNILNGENMYEGSLLPLIFKKMQDEMVIPARKFIIVSPEYNGSFPGVLKTFFDALSVRKSKESLYHKKALLIGVASGRAGNLRGLDQISGFLNHLGLIIYPNKLPISKIADYMEGDSFVETELKALNDVIHSFSEF